MIMSNGALLGRAPLLMIMVGGPAKGAGTGNPEFVRAFTRRILKGTSEQPGRVGAGTPGSPKGVVVGSSRGGA